MNDHVSEHLLNYTLLKTIFFQMTTNLTDRFFTLHFLHAKNAGMKAGDEIIIWQLGVQKPHYNNGTIKHSRSLGP